MLGDALDYPTAGDSGPVSLLVGGLLVALRYGAVFAAFAFWPVGEWAIESWPATAAAALVVLAIEVPLRGYRVRALRATARDPEADAPSFRPVASLFRDGAGGLAIYAVYLLPAVALGLLAVGGNATAAIGDPSAAFSRGVARNVAGLAVLFVMLYLVGMAYVLPAAVTNYAHEGRWRAAFHLRTVTDGAFSEDYAVTWLVSVLFQAVAYPVSLLLWSLLVGPFVQFFAAVATRYLWGYGYGRALGLAGATDEAPETTAPRPEVDTVTASASEAERQGSDEVWSSAGAEPDAQAADDPGESSRGGDTSGDGGDDDDPMAQEFQ